MSTCEICGCFNGTHGGCNSRGHDPKTCHGIHTMYDCEHECCCGDEPLLERWGS